MAEAVSFYTLQTMKPYICQELIGQRKLGLDIWLPELLTVEGKGALHLGRVCPSLWLPEPLRSGKAQNAGATESPLLWSTQKLEPHATQGLIHIE